MSHHEIPNEALTVDGAERARIRCQAEYDAVHAANLDDDNCIYWMSSKFGKISIHLVDQVPVLTCDADRFKIEPHTLRAMADQIERWTA